MVKHRPTGDTVLNALSDGKPRSSKDVVRELRLSEPAVWSALKRCWKAGLVLRSEKALVGSHSRFRGRRGISRNTRSYYLYVLNPGEQELLTLDGVRFVSFADEYADKRGAKAASKAQLILSLLRDNPDKAFFSKSVYEALKDRGVKMGDVMATVRR